MSAENQPARTPLIVITGPTASGKGAVAFELAARHGGEIVSLDSMKIYREMDVGTAKPTDAERRAVRYHLIDFLPPERDFSTGDYLRLLESTLEDVRSRGARPIICGGTALYLMGLLRGFGTLPGADWTIRERLIKEASEHGTAALHRRLEEVDPAAAATFLPQDLRRIVRALEVYERTGRPMSSAWSWGSSLPRSDAVLFGLRWERQALYARADARVLDMVRRGLFEEAARLRGRTPPLGRSARQSIGYKEIFEGWESGLDREAIIETIQRNTRRFVKRQLAWFRKLPIRWLPAEGFDPVRAAETIEAEVASWRRRGSSTSSPP